MAVPPFESFFYPFLKHLEDKNVTTKEMRSHLITYFGLTDEDLKVKTDGGTKTQFEDRISWTQQYLKRALLISSPKTGSYSITERGKIYLDSHTDLRLDDLMHYPEFVDFKKRKSLKKSTPSAPPASSTLSSPVPTAPTTTTPPPTGEYFSIKKITEKIKDTGLIYDDKLIARFACSLLTKPFVILSGLAGSGKTQLALAFAKALCQDPQKQICFVPVGADWTNREPLLGYPNALKDDEYVMPESGVLQLLIDAQNDSKKPYFLILDEMNLSYVERYFADFLSAMEAKDMQIKLWDKGNEKVPSCIALPQNLFIVGTINVDETTYMFSPKVLDRANVIEFKVSDKEMDDFLTKSPLVDISAAKSKAADMAEDFVKKAKDHSGMTIDEDLKNTLLDFFSQLKKVNAEFGYRSATEIAQFITFASKDGELEMKDAIDAAIVQKLLPKLHGSRKKLSETLQTLWRLCIEGSEPTLEQVYYNPELVAKLKYALSADKILRMYRTAIENGFTSFAEA